MWPLLKCLRWITTSQNKSKEAFTVVSIKIHPKQSVLNYFDKSIPLNKYFHIHFDKFTFTINKYFQSR